MKVENIAVSLCFQKIVKNVKGPLIEKALTCITIYM